MAALLLNVAGCNPFVSDEDRTIYFGTWWEGDDFGNICAVTPDGRAPRVIVEDAVYPRLSKDRTRIVYHSGLDGDSEIWIANADGSAATKLTDNDFADSRPCFSPDGSTILFESDRDGSFRLYTMDITGDSVVSLTPAFEAIRGEYSPNGERITFTAGLNSTSGNKIQIMDADGQNTQTILPPDFYHSWGSHWSPDGTKLAFTAYMGDGADPMNTIYTVNADATGLTPLYSEGYSQQEPQWSSDGSELVMVHRPTMSDMNQLYILSADGLDARQLFASSFHCFQPYWVW
ncbi:MAG: hypothetical protein KOO61_08590 [Spirochaetales bacterium]|nr:hypothetical protein [Spirochaetales bacterium]